MQYSACPASDCSYPEEEAGVAEWRFKNHVKQMVRHGHSDHEWIIEDPDFPQKFAEGAQGDSEGSGDYDRVELPDKEEEDPGDAYEPLDQDLEELAELMVASMPDATVHHKGPLIESMREARQEGYSHVHPRTGDLRQ